MEVCEHSSTSSNCTVAADLHNSNIVVKCSTTVRVSSTAQLDTVNIYLQIHQRFQISGNIVKIKYEIKDAKSEIQ